MFRMSKLADYGTVIMVYMAQSSDSIHSASSIAKATKLTVPTVSKLLKRLTKAQLLSSTRGVRGGYQLMYAPEDISVAAIVYALEDRLGMTECSSHATTCTLQPVCSLQDNWRIISKMIEEALGQLSLQMLSEPMDRPISFKPRMLSKEAFK